MGGVSRRTAGFALACILVSAFALNLFLYTRHNEAPFYWNPDEPSKTQQLVSGVRKFRHPQLLLTTTDWALAVVTEEPTRQQAVIVGRFVSATFIALAVVAFGAFAHHRRGLAGALAVATALTLCPHLFLYSHFLKEDSALLVGIAASLLAVSVYCRRRDATGALLLGAACGLAASGKYVGVSVLAVALPLVAVLPARSPSSRVRAALLLGAGFLVVLAVCNYEVLAQWARFRADLAYETDHATTGGVKAGIGNLLSDRYPRIWLRNTTLPVQLLAIGYGVEVLFRWRQRDAAERSIVLFAGGYALLLSLSPLRAERYLLPVIALTFVFAGLALAELAAGRPDASALRRGVAGAALLALLGFQGNEMRHHWRQFASDSRSALRTYVIENLPEEARIAQDRYAGLPDPGNDYVTERDPALPQEVIGRKSVAELGTLDELRARGLTHVAVCRRTWQRYFDDYARFPSAAVRLEYEHARDFYEDLFEEGELVWEGGEGRIKGAATNCRLRLYRIASPGQATS